MLRESEEAGCLNAAGHVRRAPAWGMLWGLAVHVNEGGVSGVLPELTVVLWLLMKIPFLGKHA